MNVVKIMGGLGNQLFQYALSRHLAQYDEIAYDITYYQSEENIKGLVFLHRDFLLPCFDVGELKIVFADMDGRPRINQWEYDTNKHYTNCWFWGDWQKASYFCDVNIDINGAHLQTLYQDANGYFSYEFDSTKYANGT